MEAISECSEHLGRGVANEAAQTGHSKLRGLLSLSIENAKRNVHRMVIPFVSATIGRLKLRPPPSLTVSCFSTPDVEGSPMA